MQQPSCFPSASSSAMPIRRIEPPSAAEWTREAPTADACRMAVPASPTDCQSFRVPGANPSPVAKAHPHASQGVAYLGDSGCAAVSTLAMLASDILRASDARRFGPPLGAVGATKRARMLARYREEPCPAAVPAEPCVMNLRPPTEATLASRRQLVGRLVGTRPLQPPPLQPPALRARRNAATAWRGAKVELPRGSC